jgi:hypothetical protein
MTIVGFEANCQSPDVFPRCVVLDALAYSVNVLGVADNIKWAVTNVVHLAMLSTTTSNGHGPNAMRGQQLAG